MHVMIELFGTTTGLTVSLSSIQIQTESGNVLEILNHDSFAKIAELSLFFCGFYLRSTTRSAEMGFPWRLISDILPRLSVPSSENNRPPVFLVHPVLRSRKYFSLLRHRGAENPNYGTGPSSLTNILAAFGLLFFFTVSDPDSLCCN